MKLLDTQIPAPKGLFYSDYQKRAIVASASTKHAKIETGTGVGATVIGMGVINNDPTIHRALVITSTAMRHHWERDLDRWNARCLKVSVMKYGAQQPLPETGILIASFRQVQKHLGLLKAQSWNLIIADTDAHPSDQRVLSEIGADFLLSADRLILLSPPISQTTRK